MSDQPIDVPALVARLRGIYSVSVNDGCGPLNGSMTFERRFDAPPIQHEAADALATLTADIDVERGLVATLTFTIERLEAERDAQVREAFMAGYRGSVGGPEFDVEAEREYASWLATRQPRDTSEGK